MYVKMYKKMYIIHTNCEDFIFKKGKQMRKSNYKVTCRPCKEENNWEIEVPTGKVLSKHYPTKSECVKAARAYAQEYGYELVVEDKKSNNK